MQEHKEEVQRPGQRIKWMPELNKCFMRNHFTAAKGAGPVRRDQYRLFLLEYRHLAVRVTKHRIADQKRIILVRHFLSKVEMETIRMLANYPPAGSIKLLEYAANDEIVEAVIEDFGAGEERKRGHDASGEVFYPHSLGLRHHASAFPEGNRRKAAAGIHKVGRVWSLLTVSLC